ncbi:GntR family transcriptional regulator [Microcoleus sp. PH2017_05_CCC_O_A]|uniref:GntR family transcriptional regulator n=1 Tax=Microcoleus sp. PH2017_05_CCC_O_A TaxID=2798816 RepID=UPI0025D8979B|nr:GntR family transcriptional regulator [Microcoleus sp. PH2017_05_CCC_O_A]
MGLSFRAIRRTQSLHEQTYQALRTAILSGELVAGERLIETQLADMLNVSRTPVREALCELQRENLVTADPHHGLRVATLSIADAADLYDCRIALEQLSVAETCQNATPAQVQQLEAIVLQAESTTYLRSGELTNYQLLYADCQFHRLLVQSSGNPWLVTLLDQVFDKMILVRLRTMEYNPGVLEIRSEHRRIFQAVIEQNPVAAAAAIQEHLIASKARVIKEIQEIEGKQLTVDS